MSKTGPYLQGAYSLLKKTERYVMACEDSRRETAQKCIFKTKPQVMAGVGR